MWLHGSPGLLLVYLPLLLLVLAKLLAQLALVGLVVAVAASVESTLFAFVAARAFERGKRRFWTRTVALGVAVPVVLCLVSWLNFAVCTRNMDLDWSSDAQTPGLTNVGNVVVPLLISVVAAIALCVLAVQWLVRRARELRSQFFRYFAARIVEWVGGALLATAVFLIVAHAALLASGAPQAGEAMPQDGGVGLYLAMVTGVLALVGGAPALLCAWLARDDGPIIVPRRTAPARPSESR
jgi:hypothetical protein